jgi:RNA polymerase sigma factor (TIGR02999 family)
MDIPGADAVNVTRLLRKWSDGDAAARDELVPVVYRTLHKLAKHYLAGEQHAQTLPATALVHEAYVRLVDQSLPDWRSRDHFYGVAAHLMRQVLVDHARERLSQKRGGGAVRLELDHAADVAAPDRFQPEILAVNSALDELARLDPRKSKVIELRYFGGCTEQETARLLSLSIATVRRDLRAGEAWLAAHIGGA